MEVVSPEAFEREPWAEADLLPRGIVHSVVWGTDASLTNVEAYLRKVDVDLLIAGHIPCDQGFRRPTNGC